MDFFGIGFLELLAILLVTLMVMGPQRLPQAAQRIGTILAQARRSIAEVRDTVMIEIDADLSDRATPTPEDRKFPDPPVA